MYGAVWKSFQLNYLVLVCAAGTLQFGKFVRQEEVELSNNIL